MRLTSGAFFLSDRQKFHRARYDFALNYVRDLTVADIACRLRLRDSASSEKAVPKAVVGIDSCREAVGYAELNHSAPEVTYAVANATQTKLPNSSVDVITSFETIEHIRNTTDLLTEFNRILTPKASYRFITQRLGPH